MPETVPQEEKDLKPYNEQAVVLVGYVTDIFEAFKNARLPYENIWAECLDNYYGTYQEDAKWQESEGTNKRSRIFIKLTAMKCNAAHAKVVDASLAGGEVPFDTKPVNIKTLGIDPTIANEIAGRFKKRVRDHFRLIELPDTMDIATLECAVLGTAVLKGPIVEMRKKQVARERRIAGMPVSEMDAGLNPYELFTEEEVVPTIDHIPLLEYYVDVNARKPSKSIMEFHFQRLLPSKFRELANHGGYDRNAVMEAARRATVRDGNDTRYIQMSDAYMGEQGVKDEKVSVLEGWGLVPVEMLKAAGCKLPKDVDEEDSIEAVVVLAADGVVIKVCINPLGRRPFHVCPYKKRPHVIYGQGVAEAMRDSQKMVNSSARMIIDNKALSGPGMLGVNLDRIDMKRTKDFSIKPYKIFYVKGSYRPSDAISSIRLHDNTQGLMELLTLFERIADEETGLPKFTYSAQSSFLNKTATGMSMLMGQTNINLKPVMRNMDRCWIEPIVEAFHAWFMQMDEDNSAKIPLEIKALGTDSLMAKEIKMENIMKFMQVASSPQDAIFMNRVKLMKLISDLLDLPEIMRTDEEIEQIMAEMSSQAGDQSKLRESIDLDKMYPMLARSEQTQILLQLGIEPDPTGKPALLSPDEAASLAGAEREPALAGVNG